MLSALHQRRSCCAIRRRHYTECSHAVPYAVGITPHAVTLCHKLLVQHQTQSYCATRCGLYTKCSHAVQYLVGTTRNAVMLCNTLTVLHHMQSCFAIRCRHSTKRSHAVQMVTLGQRDIHSTHAKLGYAWATLPWYLCRFARWQSEAVSVFCRSWVLWEDSSSQRTPQWIRYRQVDLRPCHQPFPPPPPLPLSPPLSPPSRRAASLHR